LLALGIVVVAVWWKSKRKLVVGAVVAVIVLGVTPVLPPDLKDRYLSLVDDNTKNAGSATDRSVALKSAIIVANRRPLFGHGLGTSGEANANFGISNQPAHQLYAEVAQELGFLGLLLFLTFIITLTSETARARKAFIDHDRNSLLPATTNALHVFLAMNITFSLASYGLSSYEWYFMAGLTSVLGRLAVSAVPRGADAGPVIQTAPSVHRALKGVIDGQAVASRAVS
jgi:putative inorganic carbon (hco3(-)) transporter